jgi:hypothetical protein
MGLPPESPGQPASVRSDERPGQTAEAIAAEGIEALRAVATPGGEKVYRVKNLP